VDILAELSVEPLSTIITSPDKPERAKPSMALFMQLAIVFSSFKHGMTTDISIIFC
jgi:hypothetical protein